MSLEVHNAVNQAGASLRNAASRTQGQSQDNKELGKQDFLNLMMTQMANQDPLDPMDSEKMMQQMAALGTVEQLQNVNAKLDNMVVGQNDIARATAFSYINKDVEVGSDTIVYDGNEMSPASYSLDSNADKVSIYIISPEGEPVKIIKKEDQSIGSHSFVWNGTDNEGDPVAHGNYRYRIVATSEDGEKIGVNQFKKGRISSVSFENGRPTANINGEMVPLSKVKGVSNVTEQRFGNALPLPIKTSITPKAPALQAKPLVTNEP